jgi:hypothetical protein
MNEEDWLSCTDPTPMLRYLQEDRRPGERKLRLLACACCRQIWDLLPDSRSREAVQVAERYADGRATQRELARARASALKATGPGDRQPAWAAYWAANVKAGGPLWNAFAAAAAAPAGQAAREASFGQRAAWEKVQAASVRGQVALIREVIGNPFRPFAVAHSWRAWHGGLVAHLAEGIYEERTFEDMPVLGDALEEAGCTDEAVLGHCRQARGHVRGCWVLDALLAKE